MVEIPHFVSQKDNSRLRRGKPSCFLKKDFDQYQYASNELGHRRAQNTPVVARVFGIQLANEKNETLNCDFNLNISSINSSSMFFSVCHKGLQCIVDLFCLCHVFFQ